VPDVVGGLLLRTVVGSKGEWAAKQLALEREDAPRVTDAYRLDRRTGRRVGCDDAGNGSAA
jgi:hypothetical protein